VARRTGVSRQTIIAIEKDKYDPSLSLAFALARLFETRIEDIFQDSVERAVERATGGREDKYARSPGGHVSRL
jgi:DNA-binding XRE family transcriptional regulator